MQRGWEANKSRERECECSGVCESKVPRSRVGSMPQLGPNLVSLAVVPSFRPVFASFRFIAVDTLKWPRGGGGPNELNEAKRAESGIMMRTALPCCSATNCYSRILDR